MILSDIILRGKTVQEKCPTKLNASEFQDYNQSLMTVQGITGLEYSVEAASNR
ncbi:hypothetical protein PIROE2DRAFT_16343 [Piromyces sp. E2]|nr:hypothetical protein PIROE2DRAFT_16343 [Piromyces sp. E2]|eukprot:OUM58396.1 hypothetical protein PIROE2DRAFT_16343 [Piromyces sp. E2]